MKKILIAFSIIICALMMFGCKPGVEPNSDSEQEDLPLLHMGVDTVFYSTLDELVENCPTAYVAEVMKQVSTEGMEDLFYYVTYDTYDGDRNFPIAVIAFLDEGVRYYFSGAVQDGIYADLTTGNSLTYRGIDSQSHVGLLREGDLISGCALTFEDDDSVFALSLEIDAPVAIPTYFDVLSKMTGERYTQIGDGVTYIRGDIVSVSFTSYDMSAASYQLSGDDIVSEQSVEFSPGYEEIVVFTSEPGEAGADLVQYPASIYLDLAVLGEGKASIDLLGDSGDIIYTVSIESSAENGVFISE